MLFDLIIVLDLGWNLQVSSSWGRPVHMEMTVGKLKMDTEVTRLAQCWWSHLARVVAASEVEMVEWHARHEVMPAEMEGSDWLVNHRHGSDIWWFSEAYSKIVTLNKHPKDRSWKLKQDEFGRSKNRSPKKWSAFGMACSGSRSVHVSGSSYLRLIAASVTMVVQ